MEKQNKSTAKEVKQAALKRGWVGLGEMEHGKLWWRKISRLYNREGVQTRKNWEGELSQHGNLRILILDSK